MRRLRRVVVDSRFRERNGDDGFEPTISEGETDPTALRNYAESEFLDKVFTVLNKICFKKRSSGNIESELKEEVYKLLPDEEDPTRGRSGVFDSEDDARKFLRRKMLSKMGMDPRDESIPYEEIRREFLRREMLRKMGMDPSDESISYEEVEQEFLRREMLRKIGFYLTESDRRPITSDENVPYEDVERDFLRRTMLYKMGMDPKDESIPYEEVFRLFKESKDFVSLKDAHRFVSLERIPRAIVENGLNDAMKMKHPLSIDVSSRRGASESKGEDEEDETPTSFRIGSVTVDFKDILFELGEVHVRALIEPIIIGLFLSSAVISRDLSADDLFLAASVGYFARKVAQNSRVCFIESALSLKQFWKASKSDVSLMRSVDDLIERIIDCGKSALSNARLIQGENRTNLMKAIRNLEKMLGAKLRKRKRGIGFEYESLPMLADGRRRALDDEEDEERATLHEEEDERRPKMRPRDYEA